MRLLGYHTRLALKSLRRDPGLSATIVIVMTVAAVIFCTAIMVYLRIYGPRPALSPALHQVEIDVDDAVLQRAFTGSSAAPSRLAPHTRVSFPHYQTLAASGIPARQSANFRARLLVGRATRVEGVEEVDAAPPACVRNTRLVGADFFAMFARRFRWGGAWSRDDEASGRRRAVLGRLLNQQLFGGGDSVGRAVLVDGQRFAVAGVLADDQPVAPEWDPASSGGGQDAIYLPFPEHARLFAWPETPLYLSLPAGPGYADLLASETVFVAFWLELPTADSRQAYARFLEQRLGAGGVRYHLRDLAAWRGVVRFPPSALTFFALLTCIILIGGGLIMARLLLAKGLVRGDEIGVFRALGASRRALFWRQIIEATILAGAAALLALVLAVPQAAFYNRVVHDTDIPLRLDGLSVLITVGATLLIGVAAAVYPSWRVAGRRPTVALGRR